jgi:hypothetical protein
LLSESGEGAWFPNASSNRASCWSRRQARAPAAWRSRVRTPELLTYRTADIRRLQSLTVHECNLDISTTDANAAFHCLADRMRKMITARTKTNHKTPRTLRCGQFAPLAWNSRGHHCVDCWRGVEFGAASFTKYVDARDNQPSTRAGERGTTTRTKTTSTR